VVALGVVTAGFKGSVADILLFGGSDFMVAQQGTADLSFSSVSEAEWQELSAYPGIGRTIPALFHITKAGSNPYFYVLGLRATDMALVAPPLKAGRLPADGADDEIMLGDGAAGDLDVRVGDPVVVSDHTFQVVGIYHTGRVFEDNGAYAPLKTTQELASRPGFVSVVYVKAAAGVDPMSLKAEVNSTFKNLVAISKVSEFGEVDQGIELLDAANLAISLLAVGIGAIGVMNTMVMSVYERTREIGILRAVGWSGIRVMRMIMTESLMLCVLAAGLGAALGVAFTRLVLLVPAISKLLQPEYSPDVFVRAVIVAVVVAVLGAAYPAYRAVRLTPMAALRYE
jgi:putative ABC transport system permease protein